MVATKEERVEKVDGKWPVIYDDPGAQQRYEDSRDAGSSHRFAAMCAERRGPSVIGTDSAFMSGLENGRQFEEMPELGDEYKRRAEAICPGCTHGKVYKSGLAEFPGDPEAWISGRSDVLRVAKERNYTVRGMVEHEGHEPPPKKSPALSDRVANGLIRDAIAENPSLAVKPKEELREMVVERHAPDWAKKNESNN